MEFTLEQNKGRHIFPFTKSFGTKTLGSIKYYLSNYAASHARIMEVLQEHIQNFAITLAASVVFHSVQCDLIYSTYIKTTAKDFQMLKKNLIQHRDKIFWKM